MHPSIHLTHQKGSKRTFTISVDPTAGPDPDPEMFSQHKTGLVPKACWKLQVERALERLRIPSAHFDEHLSRPYDIGVGTLLTND